MRVTLGVLAGAYKGGRASLKNTLTHSIDWDGDEKTLCGKISIGHMADPYSASDAERQERPTCRVCATRDSRFREAPTKSCRACTRQDGDPCEGDAKTCLSFYESAVAAGIPASVVLGKTKLGEHFDDEFIREKCGLDPREGEQNG